MNVDRLGMYIQHYSMAWFIRIKRKKNLFRMCTYILSCRFPPANDRETQDFGIWTLINNLAYIACIHV